MTTGEGIETIMPTNEDAGTVENDLETAENDLLTFDLPLNYLPGMDLPSKRVLKTQTTIDIITWSLLDISNGTYCSAGTEWKNGMRCDVLYTTIEHPRIIATNLN
ncbi:hypothetical protein DFQ28_008948 [Apophysomyces sp. BC1034]|nr:hypothetical protein DFQ30_008920 [Apophysomyces sp. BC1015]KAG0173466.1 hypothetical protein DFQ29_007948 [Apophysomyces sp. BC1021]KAG0185697.1 hypothetical protein DFQ28_008948 [Apophysomyces sp. BC1034]